MSQFEASITYYGEESKMGRDEARINALMLDVQARVGPDDETGDIMRIVASRLGLEDPDFVSGIVDQAVVTGIDGSGVDFYKVVFALGVELGYAAGVGA